MPKRPSVPTTLLRLMLLATQLVVVPVGLAVPFTVMLTLVKVSTLVLPLLLLNVTARLCA